MLVVLDKLYDARDFDQEVLEELESCGVFRLFGAYGERAGSAVDDGTV